MNDYFANIELSHATKALYNSRLRTLAVLAQTTNMVPLFNNPRTTSILIRNHLKAIDSYTHQSMASFMKSLLAYYKYHPQLFDKADANLMAWRVLLRETEEKANEYRMNGDPSPTQEAKGGIHLTLEKIEAVRNRLLQGDIRKLLIGFYTYIPPMRSDYGSVRVYGFGEQPNEPNYILLDEHKAVMSIGEYKMANHVGPVRQVLPDELRKLLIASLKEKPRDYVFGPMTGTQFSVWANKQLTELFDVKFTLTMFRHAYINSLPIQSMSVDQKQKIAYLMGQSYNPNQQDLYRWV